MQKDNLKLNRFIEEVTRGEASPIPMGEDTGGDRVGSGAIAEIDEPTYLFYMNDNAGPPKLKQDHWFIFSDARTVSEPGILFWQVKEQFFARRLDADQWEKFLKIAKVKRSSW